MATRERLGSKTGVSLTGLAVSAALVLGLGCAGWEVGYAVRYSENRMERTADIRAIPRQPCLVAWTQAHDADVGTAWLRVVGPAGSLTCLVVDLPQASDRSALQKRNIIVELGYANRWICGPTWTGRARDCKVRVMRIR